MYTHTPSLKCTCYTVHKFFITALIRTNKPIPNDKAVSKTFKLTKSIVNNGYRHPYLNILRTIYKQLLTTNVQHSLRFTTLSIEVLI